MHSSSTDGIVPAVDPSFPATTASLRLRQLRQEVFRRPSSGAGGLDTGGGGPDEPTHKVNTFLARKRIAR